MYHLQQYFDKRYIKSRRGVELSPYVAYVLLSALHKIEVHKVLDCGCGTGEYISLLERSGIEAYGVDISRQAVKMSKQIQALATALPIRSKSLDAIISIHVIEHLTLKHFHDFLTESHRVLRDDGMLFIAMPNVLSLMRMILGQKWYGYGDPTHINLLNPVLVIREIKRGGFEKVRTLFKLPLLLVERSRNKWIMPYYGLNRLFEGHLWLQDLFMFLMVSTPLAGIRDTTWLLAQKC